jgi:SNF2 family DNA or RNA helicase
MEETLELIDQPVAVKAAYYELMQFLTASDFDLAKRMGSEDHKSKLIHDALFQCRDVEEVLILRAALSHCDVVNGSPVKNSKLCQKLVEIRMQEYFKKKDELEEAFMLSRRIKQVDRSSAGFYEGFLDIVAKNIHGDLETSDEIKNIIAQAESQPVGPLAENEERTLRQVSTSMSTTLKKLVDLKRSWRFAASINNVQSAQANVGLECSKCNKNGFLIGDMTVLGQCGHLVCSGCLPASNNYCTESNCLVRNTPYSHISASDLVSGGHPNSVSKRGKLDDVVTLIQNVIIPAGDKVLVFVQFSKLLCKVQAALNSKNIVVSCLNSDKKPWAELDKFQKDADKKVLILNIGDASAAGR